MSLLRRRNVYRLSQFNLFSIAGAAVKYAPHYTIITALEKRFSKVNTDGVMAFNKIFKYLFN
jgi:hypothetical protein